MESAASLRQKAARYVQQEKYDLAIVEYEKVLQLEPSDASVYNHMGDIYLKKAERERAIEEYYRAVDVYVKEAYYTNAIAVCKKILRCDREAADVYERLGNLYAKQGLIGEAISNLMEYADRQMKQEKMDAVLNAYRTIAELTPENIDARKQLAEMYISQAQTENAVKELGEIASRLREQGKEGEAEAVVERIESIAPGAAAAVEALAAGERVEQAERAEAVAPVPEGLPPEMLVPVEREAIPAEAAVTEVPSAEEGVGPGELQFGPPEGAEAIVLPGEAEREAPVEEAEIPPIAEEVPPVARPVIPEAAQIEDWSECVEMGDLLLEIGSVDEAIDYYYRAASGYFDEQSYEEAWRLFSKVAELRPFELRPRQKLVEIAVANDDLDAMVVAYLDLGECLMRRGAAEEAEAIYKRVIEIDPRCEEAIERLSVLAPDETFAPVEKPPVVEVAPPAEAVPVDEVAAAEIAAPVEADLVEEEAAAPVGAGAPPEEAVPAAPEKEPEVAVAPSREEFVDLGKVLEEELAGTAKSLSGEARIELTDEDHMLTLEQMIEEFKGGVWQHIDEGDYASHYDLGIAYREMGLVNEAISEFQIASRGKEEAIKSFEMVGQCFIEKGEIEIAIRQFKRGLAVEGHREDEYIGLYYHLGQAYEAQGMLEEALKNYENTYVIDIGFADVGERVSRLRDAVARRRAQPSSDAAGGEVGQGGPSSGEEGDKGERGDEGDKPKKDRISYV